MRPLPAPWIMLVTSRSRLAPSARTTAAELRALDVMLDEAIAAGVDVIQLRERNLEARLLRTFTAALTARSGATRVLVNDRADVAWASGAHGVHLRADGVRATPVRAMRADWILGQSVHTRDDLRSSGAALDYLLFGTVFETASKPDVAAAGLDRLRVAVAEAPVPVVAIGGITPVRAAACIEAGAAGVAAIGLFLPEGRSPGAVGPARAIRLLRGAIGAC